MPRSEQLQKHRAHVRPLLHACRDECLAVADAVPGPVRIRDQRLPRVRRSLSVLRRSRPRNCLGDIPIARDESSDLVSGAVVESAGATLHRQPGVLAPCRAGPAFGDKVPYSAASRSRSCVRVRAGADSRLDERPRRDSRVVLDRPEGFISTAEYKAKAREALDDVSAKVARSSNDAASCQLGLQPMRRDLADRIPDRWLDGHDLGEAVRLTRRVRDERHDWQYESIGSGAAQMRADRELAGRREQGSSFSAQNRGATCLENYAWAVATFCAVDVDVPWSVTACPSRSSWATRRLASRSGSARRAK